MKQKSYTFKNVTMLFSYNVESRYYLDGDNVVNLDNSFMHKQCLAVWNSLENKRKKITVEYDNVLIGISDNQFNSFIKSQDKWVESQVSANPTGRNILYRLKK